MRNPVRRSIRVLAGTVGGLFTALALFFALYYPDAWQLILMLAAMAAAFLVPAVFSSAPPTGVTRPEVLAKVRRIQRLSGALSGFGALALLVLGVSSIDQLPECLSDNRSIVLWAIAALIGFAWLLRAVAAYYQSQAES